MFYYPSRGVTPCLLDLSQQRSLWNFSRRISESLHSITEARSILPRFTMVPAAALIFAALTAASGVGSFHRQRVLPVGSSPPSLSLAPDKATARGRACLASPTGPQYVINPADYGADPTGTTDATAVLQQCVNLLWNASRSGSILARTQHQLDLGGARSTWLAASSFSLTPWCSQRAGPETSRFEVARCEQAATSQ